MEFVLLSYFSRARVKLRFPIRRFEKSLVSNEILRKILYPVFEKTVLSTLTALLLILRRRHEGVETDALVELDTKDQSDFEQYTLKLSDADVIDGAGAKFPEEFFRPQGAEIVDDEGPQVKDVVPRHAIPFLDNHDLGSQQLGLYGRTKAAWPASDDQHL